MTARLVLNHWDDWLEPGSPSNPRLFHADVADRILVCPSHLGQGYFQEVLLRDDVSLLIFDYTLNQNVVVDILGEKDRLELKFPLAGFGGGYSFFVPYFGLRTFGMRLARERVFKIEILFKRSARISYLQAFMERLSAQNQELAKRCIQLIYQYQGNSSNSTLVGMLSQIFDGAIAADSHISLEQMSTDDLYAEMIDLAYARRNPVTSAMEQVIGQILSCPYQGSTRRTYLERKTLELVALRLETIMQPRLKRDDLNCIYQAASILRKQLANPPTVEMLARQVNTNRLKLNQGFRQVYGTTPGGYSRNSRLWQARRLLMTSDLSIGQVSAAVGYTCRGNFAKIFRQQMSLTPKAFQMEVWQHAG